MREAVLKLAKADNLLFPSAAKEIKLIPDDSSPKGIEFRMVIDDDFRRQQLIKTVEIPQGASFFCSLSDLSESQRELLVNIYYPNNKRIPTSLQLPMPSPIPNPKQPYTFDLHWKGKVNPSISTPAEILAMWERDYKEAFEKINATTSKN